MKTAKIFLSFIFLSGYFLSSTAWASILNIQKWQTTNGSAVYFVPTGHLPIVDIAVLFDAGSARDANLPGIGSLTSDLLNQGTINFSADQISQQFAATGAAYSANVNRIQAIFSLRSLTDSQALEPSLALFHQILTQPTFIPMMLEQKRAQQLAALQAQEQAPEQVALKVWYETFFMNHPYGHSILGNEQTVKQIKREDILSFFHQYYVSKNAVIIIVGKIDKVQAQKISEELLKGLALGNVPPAIPNFSGSQSAIVKQVPFPAAQVTMRLGQLGVSYQDPDYFSLLVGNMPLGGNLTSRLFSIVREKYGLAYYVSSSFAPLPPAGIFMMSSGTEPTKSNQALKLIKESLENYSKTGPTPEEIEAAKNYLTGTLLLKFDSNQDILQAAITIASYNLPLDYFDHYVERVKAVTSEQILKAWHKHINPAHMVTVIVG